MIEYAINFVSNFFYGLVLKLGFRVSYSAKAMRRNFDLIVGVSSDALRKKYNLSFESLEFDGVRAEIMSPAIEPKRTILYLHGGGYFMGSLRAYRKYSSMFAQKCGVRVVLIDYRLAPENPYPAALEDAVKCYKAVLKKYPSQSIVIAGDSAGGGLSLAVGLYLRDQKIPPPAGVISISPWTDLTGSGVSVTANQWKDIWLSKKHIDFWAPWYCGATDKKSPYISPAFANYAEFPPTLLLVGTKEVLVDDSKMVFESAKKDGADIQLHLGKQMQHDWMLAMPFLPESRRAWKVIQDFIGDL